MIRRFKVDQIIRDKLPDLMRSHGVSVFERELEPEELLKRLREKLVIEAAEAQHASSTENLIEELADLMEVIHALAGSLGFTIEQIEEKRVEKLQRRGGYKRKLFNPYVEIEESNPAIDYYLTKSAQYPEITD